MRGWVLGTIIACSAVCPCLAAQVSDAPRVWYPLEIDVTGPMASETGDDPNPFLDVRLDVTLTAPSGTVFAVPGFFAGNGEGGGTGSTWRIRFNPDEAGEWRYSVSFRRGAGIAVVDGDEPGGEALPADGESGRFSVAPAAADAPGLLRAGRLQYVGEHYLKQSAGDFWIKGGVDSPENFFGYAGFDNTVNQSGGGGTRGLTAGLHRYEPHIADWRPGDPEFVSVDTGVDSKGIIGAINYLASEGVNSIYFLPMNLGGDGRETYPYLSPNGSFDDNTRFDVSKLWQWNLVLNHMQNQGIVAHLVLSEQEEGNRRFQDDGELGPERKLFYRELVARFAYLNGVKWNLGEESLYSSEQHQAFAAHLRALDWAAHPLAVHTRKDQPARTYEPLLGISAFDSSSIQYTPENAEQFAEEWRQRSAAAGWPWVIDMDENGTAREGLVPENVDRMRREVLYPVYFSGGNIEWYFGYHDLPLGGDLRTEDFRTRQAMYRYMRHAREFMLDHLPFVDMQPADHLLSEGAEHDQVLAQSGIAYAVYLENAVLPRVLEVAENSYRLRWFNPRSGQFEGADRQVEGSAIELADAPTDPQEDWVVLLQVVTEEIDTGESNPPNVPEPTEPTEPTEPGAPDLGAGNPGSPAEPDVRAPVSASGSLHPAIGLLMLLCGAARRRWITGEGITP